MAYLIFRPTKRELRENLAESQRGDTSIRGRTRNTEEAHDIERRLSREGEEFVRPFAVSNDSPEAKIARIELTERFDHEALKKDPERYYKDV